MNTSQDEFGLEPPASISQSVHVSASETSHEVHEELDEEELQGRRLANALNDFVRVCREQTHADAFDAFVAAAATLPPPKSDGDDFLTRALVAAFESTRCSEDCSRVRNALEHELWRRVLSLLQLPQKAFRGCSTGSVQHARQLALVAAMRRRFPLLASEGATCISRTPVVYQREQNMRHAAALGALLSEASFASAPLQKPEKHGDDSSEERQQMRCVTSDSIDCAQLSRFLDKDKTKGRLPTLIIAKATDDVRELRRLCDRHGVWLHVDACDADGVALVLANAADLDVDEHDDDAADVDCAIDSRMTMAHAVALFECADSVSLWLPSLWQSTSRHVSLLLRSDRAPSSMQMLAANATDLAAVAVAWRRLTTHTPVMLRKRATHALVMTKRLASQLVSAARRTRLFAVQLDGVPGLLRFRVLPLRRRVPLPRLNLDRTDFQRELMQRVSALLGEGEKHSSVLSILRVELRSVVVRTSATLSVLPKSKTHVSYFQFDAQGLPELLKAQLPHADDLVRGIVDVHALLEAALVLRPVLARLVDESDEWRRVEPRLVDGFVGLGAVRYVPLFLQSETATAEISSLRRERALALTNQRLAQQLQSHSVFGSLFHVRPCHLNVVTADSDASDEEVFGAFDDSSDDSDDGVDKTVDGAGRASARKVRSACIAIGMEAAVADAEDAARAVLSVLQQSARKVRLPEEMLSLMGGTVRRNIGTVERQLRQRTDEAYHPENLLRSVPVLGTVYSWLRPADTVEDTGATFDLRSRRLGAREGVTRPTATTTGSGASVTDHVTTDEGKPARSDGLMSGELSDLER